MKRMISLILAGLLLLLVLAGIPVAAEDDPGKIAASQIVIDGVKDDAYVESRSFDMESELWLFFSGNTETCDPVDPDRVRNKIYFTWDDDYLYLYLQVTSKDDLFKPTEAQLAAGTGSVPNWQFVEQLSLWLDAYPSAPIDQATTDAAATGVEEVVADLDRNCCNAGFNGKEIWEASPDAPAFYRLQMRYTPSFDKFHNYFRSDEGMFMDFDKFARVRGGQEGYDDLETMYLKENGDAQAAGYIDYDTNTYGFEIKYHYMKGEETFLFQMTCSAGYKEWDEEGPEPAYTIANGGAWWKDFNSMVQVYYEDYPYIPDDEFTSRPVVSRPGESSSESGSEPAPAGKRGDVDGNNAVNASDALLALKASVGKVTLTPAQFALADLDGNQKINASDALAILKIAVGK